MAMTTSIFEDIDRGWDEKRVYSVEEVT